MRGRIMHIALAVIFACTMVTCISPAVQAADSEAPVNYNNIDYISAKEADQYKLPCPDNAEIYIDMLSEKLFVPGGITVVGISLDGGVKWKPVVIPATGYDLSKAFNKSCFIQLTTSLNDKKKPYMTAETDAEGAELNPASKIYSFPAISARPKLSGYMINYQVREDKTGATPGQWALTSKGTDTIISGLQIARTANGKTPLPVLVNDAGTADDTGSEAAWGSYPSGTQGINVMPLGSNGKVVKTGYLVRIAPDMNGLVPASKIKKLKVSGLGKAPTVKADYKKEIIKLKANSRVYWGGQDELKGNVKPELVERFDKAKAKAGLDIEDTMGEPVAIWIGATQKKPATMPKYYTTAARKLMEEIQPTFTAASVKISTAKYEIFNETKETYGSAVPKVTGDGLHTFRIRQKATAKGGKENATTFAASEDGILFIQYGTIEATGKKGILNAYIEAPAYDGVLRYRLLTNNTLTAVEGGDDIIIEFALVGVMDVGQLTDDPESENPDDKILVKPRINYGSADKNSLEVTTITIGEPINYSEGVHTGQPYVPVTLSVKPLLPCANAGVGLEFDFGSTIETEPDAEDSETLYYQPALAGGRDAFVTVTDIGGVHEIAELTAGAPSVAITVKTKAIGSTRLDRAVTGAGKASIGSNGKLLLSGIKDKSNIEYLCFTGTSKELSECVINDEALINGEQTYQFVALNSTNTVSVVHNGFLVIRQTLSGGSRILYVFALTDDVPPSMVSAVYSGSVITVTFDEPLKEIKSGFYLETIDTSGHSLTNVTADPQDPEYPEKVTIRVAGLPDTARYTLYLESGGVTDEQGKGAMASQRYVSGVTAASSEPLLKSITFEHGFEYAPTTIANPSAYGSYTDTTINYVALGSSAQGLVSLELSGSATVNYTLTGSRAASKPSYYGGFTNGTAMIGNLTTGQYLYIQVSTGGVTEVYCFYISRAAAKSSENGLDPVSSVTLRHDSASAGTLAVNFNRTMAAINRGVVKGNLTLTIDSILTENITISSVYFEDGKLIVKFTAEDLDKLSSPAQITLKYGNNHAFDTLIGPGGNAWKSGEYIVAK